MAWVKGCDLSHYQGAVDFDRLVDDGIRFVIVKATERLAVDREFERNRNEAERRGLAWLPYPFLRKGDGDAAIAHFLSVLEAKVPAALDWEAAGVDVATVERWMDAIEGRTGRAGLAYYGCWPPFPVSPRIARWPRWFPEYPGSPSALPRLPPWEGRLPADWRREWLVWQWTGTGRLPGVAGAIDLNRLACPFDVFRHWYATGELRGAPLAPSRSRPLQFHCSGADVATLQRRLSAAGYPLAADGHFGWRTRAALMAFQARHGLDPDGVAGPLTASALAAASK